MGESGSGARQIVDWIADHITNCEKIIRTKGASSEIADINFIKAVQSGEIIEATIEKDGSVYGTYLKYLDPKYLYVYNYSSESIECLKKCPDVNILIVNVYSSDRIRLRRAIDLEWPKYEALEDFLKKVQDDKETDTQYFDIDLFIHLKHHKINYRKVWDTIYEHLNTHNLLSNLDNFIE